MSCHDVVGQRTKQRAHGKRQDREGGQEERKRDGRQAAEGGPALWCSSLLCALLLALLVLAAQLLALGCFARNGADLTGDGGGTTRPWLH